MFVFLSYQMEDRLVAAQVQGFLKDIGVRSFMAHEDIEISRQWHGEIMNALREADVFIAILSARYMTSAFCLQESGIAVFRGDMGIIPLSTDGTISPGCMAHIQSRRIDPAAVDKKLVYSGLIAHDPGPVIGHLMTRLAGASSYRDAEAKFADLWPYMPKATDDQKVSILKTAMRNDQIGYASGSLRVYLPPLLVSHGHMLGEDDRTEWKRRMAPYKAVDGS